MKTKFLIAVFSLSFLATRLHGMAAPTAAVVMGNATQTGLALSANTTQAVGALVSASKAAGALAYATQFATPNFTICAPICCFFTGISCAAMAHNGKGLSDCNFFRDCPPRLSPASYLLSFCNNCCNNGCNNGCCECCCNGFCKNWCNTCCNNNCRNCLCNGFCNDCCNNGCHDGCDNQCHNQCCNSCFYNKCCDDCCNNRCNNNCNDCCCHSQATLEPLIKGMRTGVNQLLLSFRHLSTCGNQQGSKKAEPDLEAQK